jgi:thymidine kinase
MAELIYYHGTMNSGKSTLALQTAYNNNTRGRQGIIFTQNDRAGSGKLSSRLGLIAEAVEVLSNTDLHAIVLEYFGSGRKIEYVICDEAQFYSPEQIEQLAHIVDGLGIDVFAFGILTDFRTILFPGSQRLIELADKIYSLQVEALCWCGARATHNARIINGVMATQGEQVYIGDTQTDEAPAQKATVAYEVLCRKHYSSKRTSNLGQKA